MLSIRMNSLAVAGLGLLSESNFSPVEPLVPGLQAMAAGGVEVRGAVVVWPGGALWADPPPGRDLTGWECFVNSFHLEDEVPVGVAVSGDGEPSITEDEQLVLLRQGVSLGLALCRSAAGLEPPVPIRCVVNANATNGTFRFHRIRAGEDWVRPDLDDYRSEKMAVIEVQPRLA